MPTNRYVQYVDFGYVGAKDYWMEAGLAAYQRFTEDPKRHTAIDACSHAWHINEWLWHELNPGVDHLGNRNYKAFRDALISECEELTWVGDVCNASKHRGLGRPGEVTGVNNAKFQHTRIGEVRLRVGPHRVGFSVPMTISFADGSTVPLQEVLKTVVEFWNHRLGVA